jgi:hypothetical protein
MLGPSLMGDIVKGRRREVSHPDGVNRGQITGVSTITG